MDIHNDIVKLAKMAYKLKLHPSLFFIFCLSSTLLIIVQLKLFYFNNILK